MADVDGVLGYDGSGWNISIGASDVIGFFGDTFADARVSVGAFQGSTHKTNAAMGVDNCTPDHMRNCKYYSPTQVQLMDNDPVTLNISNVTDEDCSVKFTYQDTLTNTSVEDVYLFAYDGVDVNDAPSGMRVLAFERTTTGINTDRLSDSPGDGYAWNSSYGIGGLANSLVLDDQGSSAIHSFYVGLSATPLSKGLKSATLRLEFTAY